MMNLCTISFNFSNFPKNISSLNIGDERVKIETKREKVNDLPKDVTH